MHCPMMPTFDFALRQFPSSGSIIRTHVTALPARRAGFCPGLKLLVRPSRRQVVVDGPASPDTSHPHPAATGSLTQVLETGTGATLPRRGGMSPGAATEGASEFRALPPHRLAPLGTGRPGPRCFAASRRSLAFHRATGTMNSLTRTGCSPPAGEKTEPAGFRTCSPPTLAILVNGQCSVPALPLVGRDYEAVNAVSMPQLGGGNAGAVALCNWFGRSLLQSRNPCRWAGVAGHFSPPPSRD